MPNKCLYVLCTAFTGNLVAFIYCLAGNVKTMRSPVAKQFCVFTHRAVWGRSKPITGCLRSINWSGPNDWHMLWQIAAGLDRVPPTWASRIAFAHIFTWFCAAGLHCSSEATLHGRQSFKSWLLLFLIRSAYLSTGLCDFLEDIQIFTDSVWWEAECFFRDLVIFSCWPSTATWNCRYDHLPDFWLLGPRICLEMLAPSSWIPQSSQKLELMPHYSSTFDGFSVLHLIFRMSLL